MKYWWIVTLDKGASWTTWKSAGPFEGPCGAPLDWFATRIDLAESFKLNRFVDRYELSTLISESGR